MFRGNRFRVLGLRSCFGVFVVVFWALRFRVCGLGFRVLGFWFSCFGVFVFVVGGLRFRVLGS